MPALVASLLGSVSPVSVNYTLLGSQQPGRGYGRNEERADSQIHIQKSWGGWPCTLWWSGSNYAVTQNFRLFSMDSPGLVGGICREQTQDAEPPRRRMCWMLVSAHTGQSSITLVLCTLSACTLRLEESFAITLSLMWGEVLASLLHSLHSFTNYSKIPSKLTFCFLRALLNGKDRMPESLKFMSLRTGCRDSRCWVWSREDSRK